MSTLNAGELILMTVSGRDRPGITSGLTGVLADQGVKILDISQAVIHRLLSLSLLYEVRSSGQEKLVQKELQAFATQMDLSIECQPWTPAPAESATASAHHYAITLIAEELSAQALHLVTQGVAKFGLNIDSIKRLSEGQFGCVEMVVSQPASCTGDLKILKKELLAIAKTQGVDIALQAEGLFRRAKRLVVMDMDSTLIQSEVIDELAREKGVYDEVAAITAAAMNGQMDYDESLRRRCAKLKGLGSADLERVFARIELTPGAADLVRVLKRLGYKIAILSGGFSFVADKLRDQLGIDFAYANLLEMKDGAVTGEVRPPIVNAQRKADLLDVLAQQERVDLDQVIAIGDGANDLLMLAKAGLGIAFNAKPAVREQADTALSQKNMRSILYLLGLSGRDIARVMH
jgi:phosphoserine phosphatase